LHHFDFPIDILLKNTDKRGYKMDMKGINRRYWGRLNSNVFKNDGDWDDKVNPENGQKDGKIQLDEITVRIHKEAWRPIDKAETEKVLEYYQTLISDHPDKRSVEILITLNDPEVKQAMEECNLTKDDIKITHVSFMNFNPCKIEKSTEGRTIIKISRNATNMDEIKENLIGALETIERKKMKNPEN